MTLAQLKRDANSGKMSLELIERYGSTEIIERLKGIRKVKKSNSVAIILINLDGKESELRIDSAKLIDYDGKHLTIYAAGTREPSEEEKSILIKRDELYKKYADTYSGGFWQVKQMFEKSKFPYMAGHETIKGKRYDHNTGLVYDNSIKGEVILKYNVYFDNTEDEVFQESIGKSDAKKRYAAMKRFFKHIEKGYEKDIRFLKPCEVTIHGKDYISFMTPLMLALTTESVGTIEMFDKEKDGQYFNIENIVDYSQMEKSMVNFNKVLALAKAKGYKLKKSESGRTNNFNYVFHYKSDYYKIGQLDVAYGIIAEDGESEVYKSETNKSPLIIKNDIGIALLLPINGDFSDKVVIDIL